MRRCNFALRLQPSLLTEARKVAEAEGVALNQLINVAVGKNFLLFVPRIISLRAPRVPTSQRALKILKRAGVGKAPMKGDDLLPTKRRKAQTGESAQIRAARGLNTRVPRIWCGQQRLESLQSAAPYLPTERLSITAPNDLVVQSIQKVLSFPCLKVKIQRVCNTKLGSG